MALITDISRAYIQIFRAILSFKAESKVCFLRLQVQLIYFLSAFMQNLLHKAIFCFSLIGSFIDSVFNQSSSVIKRNLLNILKIRLQYNSHHKYADNWLLLCFKTVNILLNICRLTPSHLQFLMFLNIVHTQTLFLSYFNFHILFGGLLITRSKGRKVYLKINTHFPQIFLLSMYADMLIHPSPFPSFL